MPVLAAMKASAAVFVAFAFLSAPFRPVRSLSPSATTPLRFASFPQTSARHCTAAPGTAEPALVAAAAQLRCAAVRSESPRSGESIVPPQPLRTPSRPPPPTAVRRHHLFASHFLHIMQCLAMPCICAAFALFVASAHRGSPPHARAAAVCAFHSALRLVCSAAI